MRLASSPVTVPSSIACMVRWCTCAPVMTALAAAAVVATALPQLKPLLLLLGKVFQEYWLPLPAEAQLLQQRLKHMPLHM
jgi:hypothetical protein